MTTNAPQSRTISLPRANGSSVDAVVTLGPVESQDGFDDWINASVSINGRTFVVGGTIHSDDTATSQNRCAGLQVDTHPEMHWPGAVSAGDFSAYDISPQTVSGRVMPANFDECGDIIELVAFLGWSIDHEDDDEAQDSVDAWDKIAGEIDGAVDDLLA
jgi:hypothetical protein